MSATLTTLVSFAFNSADGTVPEGNLIADSNGDLFGVTNGGIDADTVFEIAKTAGGYGSIPTTLVSFDAAAGAMPFRGPLPDANDDLFGPKRGSNGVDTVYEIANPVDIDFTVYNGKAFFNGRDPSGTLLPF